MTKSFETAVTGTLNSVIHLLIWTSLLLSVDGCYVKQVQSDSPPHETGRLECDNDNGGIQLPDGFCAFVIADSLGRTRHLTVNENGDIYVALRRPTQEGGIIALRDTTGNGRADIIDGFGEAGGTGIDIHNGYLYFGSDTAVVRYRLVEGELLPVTPPETVVTGFPVQDQHAVKPFAFDGDGWMYVNVGAPSNACQEETRIPESPGLDPCPQLERHGGIWRFEVERLGQTQVSHGHIFASGIRNAVAIAWNPLSHYLYVVQHGRDQLNALWPNIYTAEQNAELPAEEFLLVKEGSNFGWPYCYYDQIQEKKVLAPEYGGDGNMTGRCDEFDKPIMAFPGHWAPNDVLFYTGDHFPQQYHGGAFIAFHGSWNRAPLPQQGYKVVFVPFDGQLPSGEWEIFADGFAGMERITWPDQVRSRPMGLAQGPDGSLYISDSVEGKIWRVIYRGTG
ncbi:MAG: PQQ-dependent sugar dehydrogenase [Candidatus Neomarinimicrobiota bacterium]